MKEVWKDIIEYEGYYQISNLGNIKSLDRYTIKSSGIRMLTKGKLIKTAKNKEGSEKINLSKDGIRKGHLVARLGYKAFNPDFDFYDKNFIISHKDNNKNNNRIDNLIAINITETQHIKQSNDETWMDVDGFEGYYQVNKSGEIKSLDRYIRNSSSFVLRKGKKVKKHINKNGTVMVNLSKDGVTILYSLDRIIEKAFNPNFNCDNEKEYELQWKDEEWEDIKGYKGLYQVSNLGRVKRLGKRGLKIQLIKPTIIKNGNVIIRITKDKKGKIYMLGRLVYKAFNPSFNEKDRSILIFHKDENKQNNKLDNLYSSRIIKDEIWRDVFEYEGLYQVSNMGNIKSLDRITITKHGIEYITKGKPLKTKIDKTKNIKVCLSKNGIKKDHSLARVIYKSFHANFNYNDNNLIIKHKNNNSEDNELGNLEVIRKNNIEGKWSKVKIKCITTDKEFESVRQASRFYKVDVGNISACCQGKNQSAGKIILDNGIEFKLIWKYIEE